MRENSPSAGAIVGLVLSAMGLFGWIIVVVRFEPYDEDVVRNLFTFGLNSMLLLAGGGASTALSLSGFVASSVSHSHEANRLATLGTILGGAGLMTGVAVLAWRWALVFG
jgi:hypothetical protein